MIDCSAEVEATQRKRNERMHRRRFEQKQRRDLVHPAQSLNFNFKSLKGIVNKLQKCPLNKKFNKIAAQF